MILEKFGKRIKHLRTKAGISQNKLALRCGLHRNYVSDAERGRRNVSLKALEKFASGFGITVSQLLEMEKDKQNEKD